MRSAAGTSYAVDHPQPRALFQRAVRVYRVVSNLEHGIPDAAGDVLYRAAVGAGLPGAHPGLIGVVGHELPRRAEAVLPLEPEEVRLHARPGMVPAARLARVTGAGISPERALPVALVRRLGGLLDVRDRVRPDCVGAVARQKERERG